MASAVAHPQGHARALTSRMAEIRAGTVTTASWASHPWTPSTTPRPPLAAHLWSSVISILFSATRDARGQRPQLHHRRQPSLQAPTTYARSHGLSSPRKGSRGKKSKQKTASPPVKIFQEPPSFCFFARLAASFPFLPFLASRDFHLRKMMAWLRRSEHMAF